MTDGGNRGAHCQLQDGRPHHGPRPGQPLQPGGAVLHQPLAPRQVLPPLHLRRKSGGRHHHLAGREVSRPPEAVQEERRSRCQQPGKL